MWSHSTIGACLHFVHLAIQFNQLFSYIFAHRYQIYHTHCKLFSVSNNLSSLLFNLSNLHSIYFVQLIFNMSLTWILVPEVAECKHLKMLNVYTFLFAINFRWYQKNLCMNKLVWMHKMDSCPIKTQQKLENHLPINVKILRNPCFVLPIHPPLISASFFLFFWKELVRCLLKNAWNHSNAPRTSISPRWG